MLLIKLHTSGKTQLIDCPQKPQYGVYMRIFGYECPQILPCKGCKYSLLVDAEHNSNKVNLLASFLYGETVFGGAVVGVACGSMFVGIKNDEAESLKEKLDNEYKRLKKEMKA